MGIDRARDPLVRAARLVLVDQRRAFAVVSLRAVGSFRPAPLGAAKWLPVCLRSWKCSPAMPMVRTACGQPDILLKAGGSFGLNYSRFLSCVSATSSRTSLRRPAEGSSTTRMRGAFKAGGSFGLNYSRFLSCVSATSSRTSLRRPAEGSSTTNMHGALKETPNRSRVQD